MVFRTGLPENPFPLHPPHASARHPTTYYQPRVATVSGVCCRLHCVCSPYAHARHPAAYYLAGSTPAPEVQAAGRSGGEGSAGPGEGGGANEEKARNDAPASSGVCDERAGRRLSDDCWTGPQGLAKKEESAVQQRRRKVPPFSDVSPVACSFRRRVAARGKMGFRSPWREEKRVTRGKMAPPCPWRGAEVGKVGFQAGDFPRGNGH